jgi:C1A family cysteine protease
MARLVLPNGFGHGWKPDTPDHRDLLLRNKVKRVRQLPDKLYLDPEAIPAQRDQGEQGACTGFGLTGALMWSLKAKRKEDKQLSPAFAYLQGRIIEASVKEDAGAECRDVAKAAAKLGVCLEKYLPYNDRKLATTTSKQALRNASFHQLKLGYFRCLTVDDVLQALNAKMAVYGGTSWFSNMDYAEGDGIVHYPTNNDRLEGGHAMWIVGADLPSRTVIWQQSWGDWGGKHPVTGQKGFLFMPFAYIEHGLADDFWALDHE